MKFCELARAIEVLHKTSKIFGHGVKRKKGLNGLNFASKVKLIFGSAAS